MNRTEIRSKAATMQILSVIRNDSRRFAGLTVDFLLGAQTPDAFLDRMERRSNRARAFDVTDGRVMRYPRPRQVADTRG